MEIRFTNNRYRDRADITISTDDGIKITEQISQFYSRESGYKVPEILIENLISVAFDMSRFNSTSDEDMCFKICEAFLTTVERKDLIERLLKLNP